MKLKECNQNDLRQILEIGIETYYDTFHLLNNEETMSLYLKEAFNEIKIQNELNNPDSRFFLLFYEKKPAAYLKINFYPVQTDLNDPESLELERIYVKSEYKGKGFGKLLINHTIKIAKEKKCDYVWLGVWEKNEAALAFYKKMGFVIAGQHSFRMGNELQQDYILKKKL